MMPTNVTHTGFLSNIILTNDMHVELIGILIPTHLSSIAKSFSTPPPPAI